MKTRDKLLTKQQWLNVKRAEEFIVMDRTDPKNPEMFDEWVNHKPNISKDGYMAFVYPRMAVSIANRLNKILPGKHFKAYYWGLKQGKTFDLKPVTRKFLKHYKKMQKEQKLLDEIKQIRQNINEWKRRQEEQAEK